MKNLKFYKDFKLSLSFEAQDKPSMKAKELAQLRQLRRQLYRELEKYKGLINNSFDLLWEKRNNYTQFLADNINSSPLCPGQYKQIATQLNQLDCDIQTLDSFIKQENPEEVIKLYQTKLSSINEQIIIISKGAQT